MKRREEILLTLSLLAVLSLYGFCGCDSPSSKSSLVDKTKINAQQSEITILTQKLNKQETLNKTLKMEVKKITAKNVKMQSKVDNSQNNPWPWMIAIIANNVLWLGFLFASSSWKGRRGIL